MKFQDTQAYKCRYSEIALEIFKDAEILGEYIDGIPEISADVVIFAKMRNGKYCFFGYSFGSCPQCDDWERRKLSKKEIKKEMLANCVFFKDKNNFIKFLERLKLTTNSDFYKVIEEVYLKIRKETTNEIRK